MYVHNPGPNNIEVSVHHSALAFLYGWTATSVRGNSGSTNELFIPRWILGHRFDFWISLGLRLVSCDAVCLRRPCRSLILQVGWGLRLAFTTIRFLWCDTTGESLFFLNLILKDVLQRLSGEEDHALELLPAKISRVRTIKQYNERWIL